MSSGRGLITGNMGACCHIMAWYYTPSLIISGFLQIRVSGCVEYLQSSIFWLPVLSWLRCQIMCSTTRPECKEPPAERKWSQKYMPFFRWHFPIKTKALSNCKVCTNKLRIWLKASRPKPLFFSLKDMWKHSSDFWNFRIILYGL